MKSIINMNDRTLYKVTAIMMGIFMMIVLILL